MCIDKGFAGSVIGWSSSNSESSRSNGSIGYLLHWNPIDILNFFYWSFSVLCRLTSVYLACKVDEFNVSSSQFVANLWESPAAQEKALEQILEYELLLIQQLNFHLIIHNPFRPFEGFLIDLKVPCHHWLTGFMVIQNTFHPVSSLNNLFFVVHPNQSFYILYLHSAISYCICILNLQIIFTYKIQLMSLD